MLCTNTTPRCMLVLCGWAGAGVQLKNALADLGPLGGKGAAK